MANFDLAMTCIFLMDMVIDLVTGHPKEDFVIVIDEEALQDDKGGAKRRGNAKMIQE